MTHVPTYNRRTLVATGVAVLGLFVGLLVLALPGDERATDPGGARLTASPGTSGTFVRPAARPGSPNVLTIMVDDMRRDDLRYMPRTRRLLADRGATFKNAFATYPLCCPSRASFLTGQYTHNHGVWSHREPWGFKALRDKETLPVWMQRAGYRTAFVGKYLNEYGNQPAPDGSSNNSMHYVPPGWDDWRGSLDDAPNGGTYRFTNTTLNINGKIVDHPGQYQTYMLGRHTRDVIAKESRRQGPFFMWVNYVAPHFGKPTEPDDPKPVRRSDGSKQRFRTTARPKALRGKLDSVIRRAPGAAGEKDVSDKPAFIRKLPQINARERRALREVTRQRAEALLAVDVEVERTVRALRRSGELEDTVILFTSDNGYLLGEHRIRQGKVLPYEPSLSVPLLARGPGVPAGVTRNDPFLNVDMASTIAAIGGAVPRIAQDGIEMWDVMRHGDRGWVRPVITETGPRSVTPEVEESGVLTTPVTGDGPVRSFSSGLRTPQYLYVEHRTGEVEMYDMYRDPGQNSSVAGLPRYASQQKLLAETLAAVRGCSGKDCVVDLPPALRGWTTRRG